MKYKPEDTSFELFRQTMIDQLSTVRCVSVMPQEETSAYEYLVFKLHGSHTLHPASRAISVPQSPSSSKFLPLETSY